MPTLTDIPSEVLLDFLLPALPLRDVASLGSVNRYLHDLACDPTFWRLKTITDFTFSPAAHPPSPSPDWWRRVYFGFLNPRAFVWGSSDNGRLGGAELGRGARRFGRFVDSPAEVKWGEGRTWPQSLKDSLAGIAEGEGDVQRGESGAGVIELQAGGWSFTARCSDGSVWVWGQMDGSIIRFRAASWEDKHCQCPEPTRISLPCKAEAISAGRKHLLVLDSDNLVWELTAWGKAYHHTSPSLTSPAHHGTNHIPLHIVQLSTGWTHSAALAADGSVHVWYPFSDGYQEALTNDDDLHGPNTQDEGAQARGRDLKWGTVGAGVVETLDAIPTRPTLEEMLETSADGHEKWLHDLEVQWTEHESVRGQKELADGQKVVKIAGGLEFLIALKKNGEVWYTRVKEGEAPFWQFLPYFSSPAITHITAQFESITSYATPTPTSPSSAVYHARIPSSRTSAGSTPPIALFRSDSLPDLQNKEIIQVALGDYHYAALTSGGEMFTWGQGASGQLGLGAAGRSGGGEGIPRLVSFRTGDSDDDSDDEGVGSGEKKEEEGKPFVFSITAAGWHTGALILGDPKRKTEPAAATSPDFKGEPIRSSIQMPLQMPGAFPPTAPTGGAGGARGNGRMFVPRVGFAGRGAMFRGARGGAHVPVDTPVQDQIVTHEPAGGPPGPSDETEQTNSQTPSTFPDPPPSNTTHTDAEPNAGGTGDSTGNTTLPTPHVHVGPSGVRAMPFFRVGFAGRGAVRGRGRGQGAPHVGDPNLNGVGFNPDGPE
ncbi:hypothetical protein IAT38_000485 [Cryptococcus sp. DSM 104549]